MTSGHQPLPYRQLLFAVAFIISCSSAAFGQAAARPDRGTMPNRTYSVSDIENVSLQNGNVNLSIPLAALPPIAGGKLSWVVSANYNSKLWNVTREQRNADPLEWQPYVIDTPQLSDQGGWRIGGWYGFQFRNATEDFVRLVYTPNSGLPPQELDWLNNHQWWKVVLVMPDGSEHEFRATDFSGSAYQGSQDFLRGYYRVKPEGSPMRYYSVDGSYMFATISSTLEWTVYMPDGTRIIQTPDGIQRIQDTNGNKIKLFSDTNGTHYQDEQTLREITVSCPSANQCQVWYPTVGGTPQHIDINFGTTTVQGKLRSINENGCERNEGLPASGPLEIVVLREIILPQTEPGQSQRRFTFSYNSDTTVTAVDNVNWNCPPDPPQPYSRAASSGWGELSRMVTPSGSIVDYSFTLDGIHNLQQFSTDDLTTQSITQKKVTHDGTFDIWTYAISDTFGGVTNPDGTGATEQKYCASPGAIGCATDKAGLVYRSSQASMRTERHWTNLEFSGAHINSPGGIIAFNPVVDFEYTTLLDANSKALQMSAKAFQYDYNGNVTQTTEYDWFDPGSVSRDAQGVLTGVPGSATVLRVMNNSYYNQATGSTSLNVYAKRSSGAPLILNAPQQTTMGPTSIVQLSYDGQGYGVPPFAGNLTSKSVWDDLDSKWITTSSTYGLFGNLATTTDARGKVTQFFYDDATHALPTRVVVDPENGTGTQTTTTAYDFSTGAVIRKTDPNGNIMDIDYTNQLLLGAVDPFGRPGVVFGPVLNIDGVNQRQRVTTTYLDAARQVIVAADLNAENDKLLKTRTTADMLGRVILTEQTENGTNYTIYSRKAYNQMGKITFASNPMSFGSSAVTDGWTRVTNDNAGRVTEVATFGGATQPPATGTSGIWTGSVSTTYDANFTTVTDQAGKLRRSRVDALGRLIRVDEPDLNNNLGSTSSPNQPTIYEYDVLGNLKTVNQGTQTRTFNYDSLSRLRSAINPESGTVTYTYDDNGNLSTKTDARGVLSTYIYDGLNRATSRSYSDGTPAVTYSYDSSAISNGKGRLASVSSSVSTYSYSGYDAMGRVSGGWQTLGSQTYPLSYGYDLSGHVKMMTYPSGRTVNYAYDTAGRANSVTGNLGDGSQRNYATGIIYDAASRMTKEQFGTDTPIHHKLQYNVRGQLWDIRVGTALDGNGDWNRGALQFFYSQPYSYTGGSGPDNNGNVLAAKHYRPLDELSSTYTISTDSSNYDALNRVTSVSEDYQINGSAATQQFQQSYIYDRYGNRTINQASTWGTGINNKLFTVNTANNRLGVPGGQSGTMTYDNAGNLTTDSYSGAGDRVYDAENRMTKAWGGINQWQEYAYDGDGRRVKRKVNGTEAWQVYGLGGELLAEYAQNGSPSIPQKEYGYRNGQLLVTVSVMGSGGGPPPTFADNPLQVGLTTVRALHITQLRDAINGLRTSRGMSAASWAESVAIGNLIKADHILEMRTRLDEALGAPSPAYSAGLAIGFPIKAIHVQELRDRVIAAWGSGSSLQINWLVADQLGTPRIIIDKTGALANVKRHDYLPFGEELLEGQGGRTAQQGYVVDSVRQKFTRKERDIETGLDYFGARYYASTQGRFTSTDPLLSSGREEEPQSWNRYSYVLNNPLRLIDPSGLYEFDSSVSQEQRKKFIAGFNQAKANLAKIAGVYGDNSKQYQKAQRALDAYGAKADGSDGIKNGVTIRAAEGNDGATQVAGAGPKDIRVTFDSASFASEHFSEGLGHEGSHVADGSDWVKGRYADKANPSAYQFEVDGYTVQSLMAEANNPNGSNSVRLPYFKEPGKNPYLPERATIWKSEWKGADRATLTAFRGSVDRILSRPEAAGGYNLTPASPTRAFIKGSAFPR